MVDRRLKGRQSAGRRSHFRRVERSPDAPTAQVSEPRRAAARFHAPSGAPRAGLADGPAGARAAPSRCSRAGAGEPRRLPGVPPVPGLGRREGGRGAAPRSPLRRGRGGLCGADRLRGRRRRPGAPPGHARGAAVPLGRSLSGGRRHARPGRRHVRPRPRRGERALAPGDLRAPRRDRRRCAVLRDVEPVRYRRIAPAGRVLLPRRAAARDRRIDCRRAAGHRDRRGRHHSRATARLGGTGGPRPSHPAPPTGAAAGVRR